MAPRGRPTSGSRAASRLLQADLPASLLQARVRSWRLVTDIQVELGQHGRQALRGLWAACPRPKGTVWAMRTLGTLWTRELSTSGCVCQSPAHTGAAHTGAAAALPAKPELRPLGFHPRHQNSGTLSRTSSQAKAPAATAQPAQDTATLVDPRRAKPAPRRTPVHPGV